MKRFLKRSLALLLALVMTLGLLAGFVPLSASAAEDDSRWVGTTVRWYNNSGASDKRFYAVTLYLKDPNTGNAVRYGYSDVENGDHVDFGYVIADYLLSNNLDSAVFGYTWKYRVNGSSTVHGSDEPSHFQTFSVKDFVSLAGESDRESNVYVGRTYVENCNVKTCTGFSKFLDAGYKLEISYEAAVDGKLYAAKGDHNDPPVFELPITEDLSGETFTVKVTLVCKNPSGKAVATSVRTTTVTVLQEMVDELEVSVRTPAAGSKPSYEIEFETGGTKTLADLDPDAFAGISNGMRWYDVTDNRYLKPDSDDRFQAGHQYKLYIYIGVSNPEAIFKMKDGNYDFGDDFSVNRRTDNVIIAPHTGLGDAKKALQIIVNYNPLPARVIEHIVFTDYTVSCYAGDLFQYEIKDRASYYEPFAPDAYCKNGIRWYDKTDGRFIDPDAGEVLQPGHQYEVDVFFRLMGGATFKTDSYGQTEVTCDFTGEVRTVPGYDPSTHLCVRQQIDAGGTEKHVYGVNLMVNEPVVGMNPCYDVSTLTSNVEVALKDNQEPRVSWYDVEGRFMTPDDVFEAGHTYKMRVYLNAIDGFDFPFNDNGELLSKFHINGTKWTDFTYKLVNGNDNKQLQLWFEWEPLPESNVLQLKTTVPVPGFDAATYKPALMDQPSGVIVKAASWRNTDGSAVTGPLRKGETYLARFTVEIRGASTDMTLGVNGQPVEYTFHPVDRVYIFDVPLVCQGGNPTGTKVVYTEESFGRVGATLAVDLEATVELFDIAMEYYLDGGEFTYQWYVGSREIEGATGQTFELTQEHVGWKIYVIVSFADGEWSIFGDRFEIKGMPDEENAITGIAATVEIPVVGSTLPATAVVTRDDGTTMEAVTVTFYSSNTGSNNGAEWSECSADHKVEAGKFYSALITVNAAENEFFSNGITGTVNGKAHDDRFEKTSYVNMDQAVLRIVWSPCDVSGHNYVGGKCSRCGAEQPTDPKTEGVTRLAGANRWATSLMVADEMKANLGIEKFDAIIVASGNDFADALAGSYLSTVKNAPILLGWGKGGKYVTLDEANIAYIKANLAENGTVYILGGKNAVPELYETSLSGYNVKRLGGANRFETNLLILAEAGVADGSEILVCTSTNFADSLSASATAKPILLVFNEYGKLYGKQPEFLSNLKNCTFTVIGGESAISAKLFDAIKAYGAVTRLAGANRFETSVMVAQKYFNQPTTAVLAYAWNYPDGLCGGSLAYSLKAPLILTMTKYEAKAVEYAKAAGITSGIVLGGDTLISDAAVRAIFAMAAEDTIVVKK